MPFISHFMSHAYRKHVHACFSLRYKPFYSNNRTNVPILSSSTVYMCSHFTCSNLGRSCYDKTPTWNRIYRRPLIPHPFPLSANFLVLHPTISRSKRSPYLHTCDGARACTCTRMHAHTPTRVLLLFLLLCVFLRAFISAQVHNSQDI